MLTKTSFIIDNNKRIDKDDVSYVVFNLKEENSSDRSQKIDDISKEELLIYINNSIERGIKFELEHPLNEGFLNDLNHILLLKLINELEYNNKLEQQIPIMLNKVIENISEEQYDKYLPVFNIIDSKFDVNKNKFYNR